MERSWPSNANWKPPACVTNHESRPHPPRLADLAAVIGSEELDGAAHFVEARADAHAQAVGESILARGGDCLAGGELRSAWRRHCRRPVVIEIIRRQQGDAPLIVPGVEDVANGFERPRGRFAGAEIVEKQNVGGQDGLENAEFTGLTFGIVASLNFLEQFSVVVKKSGMA